MVMRNAEVAKQLEELADLLEMQGTEFKPRAYRRAARTVRSLYEPVEDVHDRGELEELDGIGEGIASRITEYLETGELADLRELKEQGPDEVESLTSVQGLGSKRVRALYDELGIESLDDLEAAAHAGEVRKVDGFGQTLERRILEHIPLARRGQERTLLWEAFPIVEAIVAELEADGSFDTLVPVGSFRRRLETVGDVDLLGTAEDRDEAMEALSRLDDVDEVISRGDTKSSVRLSGGLQVDLRLVAPISVGAALLYFTGSKDHNIRLRTIAQDRGLKLNEYGLFPGSSDGSDAIASESEEEVYAALEMSPLPPELREATGEIEAALDDEIPELVTQADIAGDLHVHTTHSDGTFSIRELGRAVDEIGYEYAALTDHGPRLGVAGGPDADEFNAMRTEVDDANQDIEAHLLLGAEANIDPEGRLDMPADLLGELDLVLAALHDRAGDATERIVNALEAEPVDVLAHPTNRSIGSREPNDLDLETVADTAEANDVAIEINAQPDRLDLPWRSVQQIRDRVQFVVNTDAHRLEELHRMRLGVFQARKGWLRPADVFNTRSLGDLRDVLGV